jgi:uncharacterized peroxidase-related enzyme
MAWLTLQDPESASGEMKLVFDKVKEKAGKVINIFRAMGNAPNVLRAFLSLHGELGTGNLDAAMREKIALACGEENECPYCLAAHTALAGMQGVPADEMLTARKFEADDPKEAAALVFTRELLRTKGHPKQSDVQALKDAGFTERQIVELVAVVCMNIFTNYFNHVADTDIDFPAAPELG